MSAAQRLLRVLLALKGKGRTVPLDRPSTSAEPKSSEKIPIIPYVDFVKSEFQEQLGVLENKVMESEIKRLKLPVRDNSKFLEIMASEVIAEHCRLIPVGSSVSGLATGGSDLDLVFLPFESPRREKFERDFHGNSDFKSHFMSTFADLISRTLGSHGIETVSKEILPRLRVPLMSMQFSDGGCVDIQFPQTFNAIRNTNMIRNYVSVDPRLPLLYHWARATFDVLEVKNSKHSLLSSYHVLLLVIHFLQSEQCLSPWTVLPILGKTHPQLVSPTIPVDDVVQMLADPPARVEWKLRNHNKMPLGELIVRFVDYYSSFDLSNYAIFIEHGLTVKRNQATSLEVRLQLIDPYTPHTVCRSQHAAKALADAMLFLRKKFKSGQMIDTFPEFPEAEFFKSDTKWAPWRLYFNDKRTGAA